MGYDIYIGNAEVESSAEDGQFYAAWVVNKRENLDAPSFKGDEFTGKSNSRHPGYSQWGEFCKRNNIHELFFNKESGLMREHPGCFLLKEEHLEIIKEAFEQRKIINKKPAGIDQRYIEDFRTEIPDNEETHDYDKVRFEWLIYWIEWALNNCKYPAISNH